MSMKKAKLSKDDYDWLLESKSLSAWNTSGRVAADIIAAGNDTITAVWYSHIWWMIDLCQHYIELDSQEMENKLHAIWNGLRQPKNNGNDEPFPRMLLAEIETGMDNEGTTYGRDWRRVYHHIINEREYLMEMIYEVED